MEANCQVTPFQASDGYCWRYRHYPADGRARGRVVYLHGIQSHGGWYGGSCSFLASAGFSVYFLDRRGSGLNEQARGDTPSFRRLLDDIAEFLAWLHGRETLPTHLLGVSWGGKTATALHKRHPGLTSSLSLLCPGFRPRVRPPFRQRISILLARLVRPGKLFPIPLSDPELFTATPRWLEFLRNDPLSLHQATARFLVESVRLDLYLRRCPRAVQVPVFLALAEQDRIIDNEQTRHFVASFASPRKQVIEYPGHHTLEFEPDPTPMFRDLAAWLESI